MLVNEFNKEKEVLIEQMNKQNHEQSLSNSIPSPKRQPESKTGIIFNSFQNVSNGSINILEALQSKLKQKEGEIIQLQVNK